MSRSTVLAVFLLAVAVVGLALGVETLRKRAEHVAVEARVRSIEERLPPGQDFEARLERIEAALVSLTPSQPSSEEAASAESKKEPAPAEIRVAELESRVSVLADRMKGLESDPLRRGYAFLGSESEELRRDGVKTLKKVARYDAESRAAIRKMLKDPAARVRLQALNTLRRIKDKESIGDIMGLVEDTDAAVRRQAIVSLSEMGGRESASLLSQKMLSDPDENVRRAATHAVGVLQASEASEGLITLLKDPNDEIRGEAIFSLGQTGAATAAPLLRAIYDQEPGKHRVRLAVALKRLGDDAPFRQETVRLAHAVLSDPEPTARRQAVETLASIHRDESQEVFKQALQDQSPEVRRAAERAIRR